jgi:hypothetical protein
MSSSLQQNANVQKQQQENPIALPALRNCLDLCFVDDSVRLLCHFLCATAATQHLEIEARLGLLWSHANNTRYRLPHAGEQTLSVDTLLSKEYRFRTDISDKICQHVNEKLLKPRFQNAQIQHKLNPQASAAGHLPKITYNHPVLIDKFYPHPTDKSTLASDCRVSIDAKTGEIVNCITKSKTNIAVLPGVTATGDAASQLDFSTGSVGLDFRISAKIETPVDHHLITKQLKLQQSQCHLIRLKDRMSYHFDSLLSIDVTRVTTWKSFEKDDVEMHSITTKHPPMDKGLTTYEIELELLDYQMIRREAKKHAQGQISGIPQLAQWFYENIRTLAKYSIATVPVPASCRIDVKQQQEMYKAEQQKKRNSNTQSSQSNGNLAASSTSSYQHESSSTLQSPAAKKAKFGD